MSDIRPGDYVESFVLRPGVVLAFESDAPDAMAAVLVIYTPSYPDGEEKVVEVVYAERNTLTVLKCRACGHSAWEHTTSCRHSMVQDHGYNTDSICGCRRFAKTIYEVLPA